MDTIFNWLLENYPWIAPTIVCCWATWKISGWKKRIDQGIDKVDQLPCESHLKRIERHDVQIAKDEEDIKNTNDRIDGILLGMSMGVAASSKKKSPYTLTEFGEYILSESQGKECVDRNKDFLFERIESGLHSTPFDIERGALRAVWDLFLTDKANEVKNYIYNSPDTVILNGKEYKLNQNDVQVAMALYLRDLYLDSNANKNECKG